MRTAEHEFRQANDPNGVTRDNSFNGANGPDGSGSSGYPQDQGAGTGSGRSGAFSGRPTILFRESSTLFRRASVSFCRRLGEADGALLETDIMSLQVSRSYVLVCLSLLATRGVDPRWSADFDVLSGGGVFFFWRGAQHCLVIESPVVMSIDQSARSSASDIYFVAVVLFRDG